MKRHILPPIQIQIPHVPAHIPHVPVSLPFAFILPLILLCACHSGIGQPDLGNGTSCQSVAAAYAIPLSARYRADSLRLFGRIEELYARKRDREAIPYLDSVFLLPARLDPAAPRHPDSLSAAEARLLGNRALRHLMADYNILMDFEGGLRHLDSLQRLRLPLIERYCLRGLLVAKAQMLMALQRHTETLECLDLAARLAQREDSLAATLDPTFAAPQGTSAPTDPQHPAAPNPPLLQAFTSGLLETPEYDSYWSGASGITYMGADTLSARAEAAFRRVIDIARRTGFRGGLYSHSMGRLADIYLRQGKYHESIALCEEAIATDPSTPDEQGRLVAAENLTEAYRRLGLYEDALRYCAIVTDAPTQYAILDNLRGRSYQNKAAILADMHRPAAEALHALRQADSCFARTGNDYLLLQSEVQRAQLLSTMPDSLPAALLRFARLHDRVPPHSRAFYLYAYGKACTLAGEYARAIPLLEEALRGAEGISDRLMAHDAARLLTDCYLRTGRHDRLARFLPRYRALADSMLSDAKIRQLAAANIRFETEKKEQQNRALTAEVALKESHLHTALLVGALCLLIAAALVVTMALRRRLERQKKEGAEKLLHEREQQLRHLIQERQRLNAHNLDLLRRLQDIQALHENSCDMDGIMESLYQNLCCKENTERFRQNFSMVYPMALNRLRSRCADLTYNDELFCMLTIFLLDNSEMAHTLGISKASVSKTRYRVRVKLNLPEGTDVDEEVRKIMKGGD